MTVKRADWVTTQGGGNGFVVRLARDGSWADVKWREPTMDPPEWTKRMPTSALIVRHTLPLPGWTVTDMDREEELRAERAAGAPAEAPPMTRADVAAHSRRAAQAQRAAALAAYRQAHPEARGSDAKMEALMRIEAIGRGDR